MEKPLTPSLLTLLPLLLAIVLVAGRDARTKLHELNATPHQSSSGPNPYVNRNCTIKKSSCVAPHLQ